MQLAGGSSSWGQRPERCFERRSLARTNPRLTESQSSQGPRSRGVIMLTINGRPIAFHEYRRRRHRRPERALVPLTLIIAAGVWLLT